MPHDPELLAETRAWFVRADRDLVAGRVDLAADPPLSGDGAFDAQQAAEQAMVGCLAWHSHPFSDARARTDVSEMCVRLHAGLAGPLHCPSELGDDAWKVRYPGEPDEPPRREVERALSVAH